MRGMILAGGAGTRLFPLNQVASKQLQPVYDKPMIYYPLETLMSSGIRDICLISSPHDLPIFQRVLGSGEQWGVDLSYEVQPEPGGIAQAVIIGERFVEQDPFALVLGDNIFHGETGLKPLISAFGGGAVIWGYRVQDPQRYGVIEIDSSGSVLSIEEKPDNPKSDLAVPGLYVYDGTAVSRAKDLTPSSRGELEITDLNLSFLDDGQLSAVELGRDVTWMDSGTHESLLEASEFVKSLQTRQGLMIGCPEEIAFKKGWITNEELKERAELFSSNYYGNYLLKLLEQD